MVTPKVAPGTPVPPDGAPTAAAVPASEHLVSAARSMVEKPVDGKEVKPQAAARAEHELERIEHQIGQLENAAGDNQEARRQLEQLHAQVHALRRQMDAHLHAWHKAELARHPQRPYTLDYVERVFTDWSEIPRRPRLRRRSRHRQRHGPLPRRTSDGGRPSEGPRHQAETLSQLRHAQSRGLPQGAAG